jgi:hypothetical protein
MMTVGTLFASRPGKRLPEAFPSADFPFAALRRLSEASWRLMIKSAPLSDYLIENIIACVAIDCQFIYNRQRTNN